MCRALIVVCVAPDRESLAALKRAAVGTEWELAPGAVTPGDAVAQVEERRAHVLVVSGPAAEVAGAARARWPYLRILVVGEQVPEASAVVGSLEEVRGAVRATPPPGGPVRSRAARLGGDAST